MHNRYRQHLPALNLSIERFTDSVPDDGGWYLIRAGQILGRYRSLKAAREAWTEIVEGSDWEPARFTPNGERALREEQKERWARNRAG